MVPHNISIDWSLFGLYFIGTNIAVNTYTGTVGYNIIFMIASSVGMILVERRNKEKKKQF